jgi:histidine triad (HIT) family protein
MIDCLFCKIIAGEIPCHKVWEDEQHLAFLDIHPMREGHTLVIPKLHASELFEMDDAAYQALMAASKTVAVKLKAKLAVPRVGAAVEGFLVDHAHIHLIPLTHGLEASDFNPSPRPEPDHVKLTDIATKIR